jgi:putative transcriptional regulator
MAGPRRTEKNRIREIREALGLSVQQAANRAGLTRRGLRLIENGEHTPRLDTARRIADALGAKVSWIFPEASDD